jgi:Protein of unknown function (DUF4230)
MRKTLTKYLLLLLVLLAVIILFQRIQWLPSFGEWFKSKPVEIENTAIVIKEINALAQLITVTAYNEVVISEVIKGSSLFNNPVVPGLLHIPNLKYPDKKLVLVGKGKVLVGIDLSKVTDKDIFVKGDSVAVRLPKAMILQVIINPSDYDIFEETGKWTDEETRAVKLKLKDKLIITVLRQNILQKAADRAKLLTENFLAAAGFKKVTVVITPNEL